MLEPDSAKRRRLADQLIDSIAAIVRRSAQTSPQTLVN
jgi:hypothetical protein